LPNGAPDEVEVDEWDITGFSPTQFCEKLRFGVKFPWFPNLNSIGELPCPQFGSQSDGPGEYGLRRLEAWITFALRNTVGLLSPWRSLSWIGWRNWFCFS